MGETNLRSICDIKIHQKFGLSNSNSIDKKKIFSNSITESFKKYATLFLKRLRPEKLNCCLIYGDSIYSYEKKT